MLLGRGGTKAFRDRRRCSIKRDRVLNKGTRAMEERENYRNLQEFTEEPTPGGNRLIHQHNNGIVCLCDNDTERCHVSKSQWGNIMYT